MICGGQSGTAIGRFSSNSVLNCQYDFTKPVYSSFSTFVSLSGGLAGENWEHSSKQRSFLGEGEGGRCLKIRVFSCYIVLRRARELNFCVWAGRP